MQRDATPKAGVARHGRPVSRALQAARRLAVALLLFSSLLGSGCSSLFERRTTETSSPATSVQYYVDSRSGSDDNPGTAPDRPWRTLARVEQQPLRPGDTVHLACGSTWEGGLVASRSGEPGRPVAYQAYGSGERPVLGNPGRREHALSIHASWVLVQGLRLQDAPKYGVHVAPGAAHNVIRDCEATRVGTGFALHGSHNLVDRSWAHDLTMIVDTPGGDNDYGAVGVALFASYNEVAYCRMERCRAPSHDYGQDGGAVEIFGDVSGSYVHHNWAADNNGFLEVGGGAARDTVVAYNVALGNGGLCVLHLQGRFASIVSRLCIDNNTVIETGTGDVLLDFDAAPTPGTLLARNNIVYVGNYRRVANSDGFDHDHNLFYLSRPQTALGFQPGPTELLTDPLFVDLARQDVHLQPESPARGAGTSLHYDAGHPNLPPPDGATPDLGALQSPEPSS